MSTYDRFKTISDTVKDMILLADGNGGVLDFKSALGYVNAKGIELFMRAEAEDTGSSRRSDSAEQDQGTLK